MNDWTDRGVRPWPPYVKLVRVKTVRITHDLRVLLRLLLADRRKRRYGYQLMQATGWGSGKIYPMLAKLCKAGWIDVELEQIDASAAKRPPRRWYRLNAHGAAMARAELAKARAELGP